MHFDPENKINQLCAQGMQLEGEGKMQEAARLFMQAWNEAVTDLEKFTAAHYVARKENTVEGKLEWDKISLRLAMNITGDEIKATYPSLHLNIAKGYEDMREFGLAEQYYLLALSFVSYLGEDGYGKMITAGINNGIERLRKLSGEE